MSRSAAIVRVEGVAKRFPVRRPLRVALRRPFEAEHIEALRAVTLEVRRGELFGLLGPNGAGKTTLFKVLSALVVPDSGQVEVAGRDVVRDPAAGRRVLTPVIADERSLNWRLSGLDNLRLYAALYGVPRSERTPASRRLLEVVGLRDAAERLAGTYSSGMKQRLLIARALLSKPEVLLLDEPTRSLDPVSARDLRRFLREEIVGRQGCTVLLATHDPDEALDLCDRLGVLHRGRLVAQGTARELAALAGEHRYRVVVAAEDAAPCRELLRARLGREFHEAPGESPGAWRQLSGEIPGGPPVTAELLSALSAAGIRVAELARVPLALADLIERIVRSEGA